MKQIFLATALMLLGSLSAFADTHYHVAVDGLP